jgi:Fe-S-cluster containining protein
MSPYTDGGSALALIIHAHAPTYSHTFLEPADVTPQDRALAQQWVDAAREGPAADALRAVYIMIADQIEERRPACWASGRCCNFLKTGHRLYTTGFEAAFALVHAPSDAPPLTPESLATAVARGDCPFLIANLCGMHTSKPMGCRVYFCDTSAQEWQMNISERAMGMIRDLHERYNITYQYAEWRYLLGVLLHQQPRG